MGGIGQEALEVPPSYQITVFKKRCKKRQIGLKKSCYVSDFP